MYFNEKGIKNKIKIKNIEKEEEAKLTKTYNTRDSLVVTDPTTNLVATRIRCSSRFNLKMLELQSKSAIQTVLK
jgi:hypothetical protein